jgi:hypothetical protein
MSANKEILMKFITAQNEKIRKDVSMQGYKDTSPYKNNPSNTIYGSPQGTPITMKGVSTPLIGTDEFGNMQEMFPGEEYFFPGSRVKETRMQNGGQNLYNVSMNNPMIIPSQGMNPVGYYDTLPKNEAGIPYDKDGRLFTQSKMVSRFDENGKPLSAFQVRENQKMWNMQKMAYGPVQQTFNLWKNNPQNTEQGFYNTREYSKYLKNIIPTGKDVGLDGLCDPNFSSTKCGTSKQHAKEDKKEWSKKQEGGEQDFNKVKEWYNNYIDSPLYKRNLQNSGYIDVDKVIEQRKSNIGKTEYVYDENRLGTYYQPNTNVVHHAPKKDSEIWSKEYESVLPQDTVLAHEFGHSVLDNSKTFFGRQTPGYNRYDYEQLQSRNKDRKISRGANENYADQKALQYEAAKLGIYNPGFEEFTEEHLDKLPTDLKDRALQNYSKEDLIWLMNNIAQNDENSNDQLAIAQEGGATRADSLDVYNRALKIDAYYENLRKKGWYPKREITPTRNLTSKDLEDQMRSIDKESRKTYKKQSQESKEYSRLKNVYPNADPKKANLNALAEHIKLTKGTKYASKDNLPSIIDPMAPTTVIDTRIIPKERVEYETIEGVKHDEFFKKYPNYTEAQLKKHSEEMFKLRHTTPPSGTAVHLYRYDPLSVKPWDMLTDAEKKLRVEKYGIDGVPKSYLSKNSIEKETDKPVEVKPQLQPRVEALNLQPIEQAPINIPIQELDFNTPIKAPKSYNVSSQRTNVNGINDFYTKVQQGVDYEQALKSKQASDAYNKYIQEKYGNEEALKNPKAVERLKQLRSEFNIESNYKFGGDLYQYQNGSQTWDKQKQNLKNEKLEKLKKLLSLPDPVFKAKTFEEKVAEKMEQEKYKTTSKDNTTVRNYNNADKHSNAARNLTKSEREEKQKYEDEQTAKERKAIREKSDANVLNQWSTELFNPDNYTRENFAEMAKGLESQFRVSDKPNFFDDYLNPANMIGGMASNLGQAPLQAEQSDSYLPYVTSIGAPLMLGAAAGLGTANNAQFINNIVNPVAGVDDVLKGIMAPKNILVDEQYMGNNLMLNALNDVKSTTLPSKTKLNELRDALEHGEQWKYPDMNFAEEIAKLKKSAKTEADIAYIDALEKQYNKNVTWHDAARNRANPVFLTGQSLEDMVNPLFKNPEGDQWFGMQQFRHAQPKGKHFGYMADEADYIHASKYRLPGNRFDTEGMMKDIGDDASTYFNERYKPLSPDFKNLPLNQKGGLVNFLQKAQVGIEIPKLNVTELDFSIPKSTGYAWADEKLKQQNKAFEEFKKVKKKVDIEVKNIQKKHNVSESTAREVYKRQQGLSEQQQPTKREFITPREGNALDIEFEFDGCVGGLCKDYMAANNIGESSLRQKNNFFGNAWELNNNTFGKNIDFSNDDYSQIKVNDLVTLTRQAFNSDKEKGIPEENQHVGRISKIVDGVPYVKHYIKSAKKYYEEPLNNIKQFTKYTPSAIKRLDQFSEINLGGNSFKYDAGYKPNKIEKEFLEGSKEKINIQKILNLDNNEYDELEKIAYGIIGAESDFGRSSRTLYRMSVPDAIQKLVKVGQDVYNNTNNYDENLNNLSQGYSSLKESSLHGVADNNSQKLKEIQKKIGAKPDGTWGKETKKKLEEYNKANPDSKIDYQDVNTRIKSGDYTNIDRTNNYLHSVMGELGLTPDDLENGKNSYKAAIANLAFLKKRYPNSTEEDLLRLYTGKKDISSYKQKYDSYIKNINNDPDDNLQHSLKSNIFGTLSSNANFINNTLKDMKSEVIGTLRDVSGVPLPLATLMGDVLGSKKPITEKTLSPATLNKLRSIVETNVKKGKMTLDYSSYFPKLTKEEQLEVSGGMGNNSSSKKDKLKKLMSPEGFLQNTLGQANIIQNEDGTYTVTDTYDFNDQGKSFSVFEDLKTRGIDPYSIFRSIGRNYGSQDGTGSKVKIKLNDGGMIKDDRGQWNYPGKIIQKAQEGKEITVDEGDGKKRKILIDSKEYADLYNEYRIGVQNDDESISFNPLNEVVITPYDKEYPYYQNLSAEEKKHFNDDTPIGRAIRSKAQDGVGFNADKATDFAMGWLRDLPLAGVQASQSALVEGVEAVRGNDYNFLNVITPGEQRLPSNVWGIENDYYGVNPLNTMLPPVNYKTVGNTAMDILMDPSLIEGLFKQPLQKGIRQLGNIKTSISPELRQGLQTNGFLDMFKFKKPITTSVENIAQPTVFKPWEMQELPGLHLKSTMKGEAISRIVEPKTGLVNVEQALGIIGKESGGADKVALIKQGLGDNIPKKMDFNEFRKTVQDQLIPLERQFSTLKSDYGINNLGYNRGWKGQFAGENVEILDTMPLENQTLILGNKGKLGGGSSAHGNPDETLGHAHFLRDAETPDILTVTQIQSDAFQGTHRIMPKVFDKDAQLRSLSGMEKIAARQEELVKTAKQIDANTWQLSDGSLVDKSVFENLGKGQSKMNAMKKAEIENFTQKQLLDKNHQERYLQELVDYAGKRGDVNKVRVPTSETAAKVQGYNSQKVLNRKLYDAEVEKLKASGKYTDDEIKNISVRLRTNPDYFTPAFSLEHQTILKKYSEQPKTIKKLFGTEPQIVTDSKGNTWYEFDIPEKFKQGTGEIKAFSSGGAIGTAGVLSQTGEGSWKPKMQTGGEKKWLGNTLDENGYITSATKAGNRISFTGNERQDEWINKQIDSGKFGFDPKTGGTFPLKKPVKGLSKEDQFMATKQYTDLIASEGFNTESQKAQIEKLPEWQQNMLNEENTKRRKNVVYNNMQDVVKNPLFYAPGAIALAPIAAAGLTEAGILASPYIQSVLATQLPGMAAVPGATVGNAITAGFAGHGLRKIGPDSVKMYENPSWENAFHVAMDVAEVLPVAGPAIKTIGEGLYATGRALGTESGLLSNAWKLNSNAEKLNKATSSYRVAGLNAFDDFKNTGVLRSKTTLPENATFLDRVKARSTSFPSFQKGYADMRYANPEGSVVFETSLPTFKRGDINPVTGLPIKGRHYAHRVINPETGKTMMEIPAADIKVFGDKPHWWKGYQEIKTPKTTQNFKSEIDWGKWNKEILDNPQLMKEYEAIEQTSKANGTWMKNADGSKFEGTPEQFIQMNSENFKKAYPNGINKVYRGVGPANNNPDFSKGYIEGDKAIFTADKDLAQSYAWGKQKENILTPFSSSTDSGIYELGFPKGDQINYNTMASDWTDINLAKASSKLNLEMNLEYQKKALQRFIKNYEGSVDDDLIIHTENRIKQLKDYIKNYDNIPTNHEELRKMRTVLGDTPSTDEIAAYLPNTNLNNITLQNVIDGGLGDVTIVNNRVGNYLKSLRGNNGMFDMNNPNIFKTIVPGALGLGAASQMQEETSKEMGGMLYANKNAKLPHEQSMKKYLFAQKNLLEFMNRIKTNGGMVPFDEYYKQNIIFPRNKS